MAATTGTKIVKDGLVLNIDAANVGKNAGLTSVEYLIVAGGGAGGGGGGAGGGGGVLTGIAVVTSQVYIISIGAGGVGVATGATGANGSNSSALGLTAIGGGGGGALSGVPQSGGSGGGGNRATPAGGAGTIGQGNAGGLGGSNSGPAWTVGGGGGGAGGPGQNANVRGTDLPGNGGIGLINALSGTPTFYAGGGGAGTQAGTQNGGAGGLGGGGAGGQGTASAANATPNTGGGGGSGNEGGSVFARSGDGGSGIVIIRYSGPQRAVGGTVTQVDGNTIHTFTTVGNSTFTPLTLTNNAAFTAVPDLSTSRTLATAANGPVYNSDNGGSFVFNGVDDFVNISNASIGNFGTSNFTVSCWGKATSGSSGTKGIFSKYNPHSGNGTGWFMFYRDGQISVRITQDLVAPLEASSIAVNIEVNKWYFFTMVRNANSFFLYSNGVLLDQRTTTNIINCSSTAPLRIGSGYSSGYYYSGNCSNASIYNRALSAAEVQQNFEATRGRYGI